MNLEVQLSNLDAVVRHYELKKSALEEAVYYAVGQTALAVERDLKLMVVAGGSHAKGTKTPASPGGPPARITGNLQRSVLTSVTKVFSPVSGFKDYKATVGPTIEYARWVDEGSSRWTEGVNYPYMQSTLDRVKPRVNNIFSAAFVRKWNHG